MSDNSTFSEVTHESWFSRIGGAIKGVLVGAGLFVVAFPVLFLNEGRAVKTYQSLKEGAGIVASVPADAVNPAQANKLVHLTARAVTDETLADPDFGIVTKAIQLKRKAEVYQWQENAERRTEKKLGGSTQTKTTYSYSKTWAREPIDSSRFKQPQGHENPTRQFCQADQWTAKEVRVGAFQLGTSLVRQMNQFTPLLPGGTNRTPASEAGFRPEGGGFFRGQDPGNPQVGDERVTFQQVLPADVSVVAMQVGTTLSAYATKAGGTIEMLKPGVHSAESMFQAAQSSNAKLTWILRLVGFVMMFIGISMILKPLSVCADVLPFLGNIAEVGTGLVAMGVAGVTASVTIAVAWLFYRPVLAITLLVVAIGAILGLRALFKSRKAAAVPEESDTIRKAA